MMLLSSENSEARCNNSLTFDRQDHVICTVVLSMCVENDAISTVCTVQFDAIFCLMNVRFDAHVLTFSFFVLYFYMCICGGVCCA